MRISLRVAPVYNRWFLSWVAPASCRCGVPRTDIHRQDAGATRRQLRPGYTLLEVLIASTIAVLLLSALYFAFDITLRTNDAGRALVSESNLNRSVVNRMAIDLSSPLGVLPPMSGGANSATGSTATENSATADTTGATATGTTSTATAATDTAAASTSSLLAFQGGVIGTSDTLILFVSKVPQWLVDKELAADPSAVISSDAHRISYYIHSGGKGLCRQKREWITSDKVGNSSDIDRSTEDDEIIAPEVVEIAFEYADGTGYLSEWDGTQASTDGSSSTGPPRAIKATITFEFTDRDGKTAQKKLVHVFPIRSAVGLIQPEATTTTTEAP